MTCFKLVKMMKSLVCYVYSVMFYSYYIYIQLLSDYIHILSATGDVLSGTGSDHLGVLQGWFGVHWWNLRAVSLLFIVVFIMLPLVLYRRVGM